MALTDSQIRQAKPREKPYKMGDSGGLYLHVKPNGGKYWRIKYRYSGKEKTLSVGVYPKVTLKAARKACVSARDLLDQDIDPSQEKKAHKVAVHSAQANNFEAIAREWHQQQATKWSDGYSAKILTSIERDLFPYLGAVALDQITPPQLLTVLRRVESRGATESAHRLKQTAGQIYRYGVATGRAERDITPDLRGALAPAKKRHFPAITEPDGVGRLLVLIDGYEGTETVRNAMKLAPLVFVRPIELRHAEWSEIDWGLGEWRIPGSKMKMGEDHIVPLSRQAIAILRQQELLTGKWDGFVFPSARSPRRPMSDNAILSAFRNMGIGKDEMTGHGFRAMARTLLDEVLQMRVEIIEQQLAHAVKDPLGRAYNRTKHLPERKLMMQRWAAYLDQLRGQR